MEPTSAVPLLSHFRQIYVSHLLSWGEVTLTSPDVPKKQSFFFISLWGSSSKSLYYNPCFQPFIFQLVSYHGYNDMKQKMGANPHLPGCKNPTPREFSVKMDPPPKAPPIFGPQHPPIHPWSCVKENQIKAPKKYTNAGGFNKTHLEKHMRPSKWVHHFPKGSGWT